MPQVQKTWKIAQAGGESGGGPMNPVPEGQAGEVSPQPHEGAGHEGGSPLTHHPALQYTLSGIAVIVAICLWAFLSTRNLRKRNTGRAQSLAEMVVEGLRNFARTSIGPGGEKYAPFIGSLFLFILVSNLAGALPLLFNGKPGEISGFLFLAPMANISMTFALAAIVFVVVQVVAFRSQGFKGRMEHLLMPAGKQFWFLAPLFGPLEIISELIRPLSLTLRLFGNIFGDEMIVATIIGLSIALPAPLSYVLPLHWPMVVFGLLTAVVQAGVFTLLTCIYLQLAQAHADHGEEHGHAGDHGGHHFEPVAGPEGVNGAFAASTA